MFEPQSGPRLFHLPPGCDFSSRFLDGLASRITPLGPLERGRVRVVVNTQRAARLLMDRMVRDDRFDGVLPRVQVLADLTGDNSLPPAISETRRMFWLAQLVDGLLRQDPTLAPRSARFDLARALGGLLDELHEAGITPDALTDLDVAEHAAHWQISLKFVELLGQAWPALRAEQEGDALDPAARSRMGLEALLGKWAEHPPAEPIIIAGSTGSRAGTRALMQAVAQLPQGAVVLPGYDTDLPLDMLAGEVMAADHPQYGLRRLSGGADVPLWSGEERLKPRHRLISTSLRPAPVTDGWLEAAPALRPTIGPAMEGLSWLEAPAPREEAEAIAFAIREAVEAGQSVALVTPDRSLSRRVSAALDRWRIVPDDSAGRPLHLTPPGVLFRLLAQALGAPLRPAQLVEILKHPLVGGTGEERRLHLRRIGGLQTGRDVLATVEVDWPRIEAWAEARRDPGTLDWVRWIRDSLVPLAIGGARSCADGLDRLRRVAEALSLPGADGARPLWQESAGQKALETFEALCEAATIAGPMSDGEIAGVLDTEFGAAQVRAEGFAARPGVSVLGTLEARMQHADLIILGGLNEAIWPKRPTPDPWINRDMRKRLGLPLPEREIGLAAHDYQLAVTAPRVLLTRAVRAEGAPTVASRWLIRLENLVSGLGEEGKQALGASKARGARLLGAATVLDRPQGDWPVSARREAPAPPVEARPRSLAVTRIETLIRDPYAIYAQKVLGLHEMDALGQEPDARLRGEVLHKVMEHWVRDTQANPDGDSRALLEAISARVLEERVEWPAIRVLWQARLMQIADTLCAQERARQEDAHSVGFEVRGEVKLPAFDFTLTGTADRIDLTEDGRFRIYDYKSGEPPSKKQVAAFAQQLPLEKLIAEAGGFDGLGRALVAEVAYLGLNSSVTVRAFKAGDEELVEVAERLPALLAAFDDPGKGYSPRSRPAFMRDYETRYDLVSRYGEWGDEVDAVTVEVGR